MEQLNSQTNTQANQPKKALSLKERLKEIYAKFDSKLTVLIPNTFLKKVLVISMLALFVLTVLLILLGLMVSSSNPRQPNGFILKKPNIVQSKPTATPKVTENTAQINKLRDEINSLQIPDNTLAVPSIERDLTIEEED